MFDIRLLTLYKQHYRDEYKTPLKCDYCCWGYFDGMDISPCPAPPIAQSGSSQSSIFSTLWFAHGKKTAGLKGDFSTQNIGLLRYHGTGDARNKTDNFWEETPNMPFFAVMLVQLKSGQNVSDVSAEVENKWSSPSDDPSREIHYNTISYCTFDNADLVLLIHSNSLLQLHSAMCEIEATPHIRYVHSILGVSEDFLSQVKNVTSDAVFLQNNVCLNEVIPELQISVVTNGDPATKGQMRLQLEQWAGDKADEVIKTTVISNKNGHETFVISLRNIAVADMLRLFTPGGFGTHQNPLYGKSVYNIATSLLLNQEHIMDVQIRQLGEQSLREISPVEKTWCKRLIEKYCCELQYAHEQNNDSLGAYCHAMLQTLNTMSQYEQFGLSDSIFLALIPSFRMFSNLFYDMQKKQKDDEDLIRLENAFCKFLDYTNMVIYHIIHTDQTFLMVPGYSGTSFSIPIKLTLLFLWLCRKLTYILNDSHYEYQCILTPVMESKPMTHLIELDKNNPNRLIAIKVSQRLLYRPQSLTIILSHEIAHYVGTKTRCRKQRLEHLTKLLAYYVTEQLLPNETLQKEGMTDDQVKLGQEYYTLLHESLHQHLKSTVKAFDEEEPFAQQSAEQLAAECRKWLLNQSKTYESLVFRVPKQLENGIIEHQETYVDQMKFLTQLQKRVEGNWRVLLEGRTCEDVIEESVSASREIFSDMVAFATLGCTMREFEEAFNASEGIIIDELNRPAAQWFRQDIAFSVVNETDSTPKTINIRADNVKEMLYQYEGVQKYLKSYAKECYQQIKCHLEKPEILSTLQEIRRFYNLFSVKPGTENIDIYARITEYITEYKNDVKERLREEQ